jgi:hypothetical protein
VVGNNDYRYLPKLQTAVNDATEVARLLHDRYGFVEPTTLLNSTHDAIITELNVLRRNLPENSNLLIYYAGHGYHDPGTDKAYWLPVDAEKDNNEHWISADDITSDIKAIPSQHVLIISDSCYSGALVPRGADIAFNRSDYQAYLEKMLESPSRTLMASGRNEPVADNGSAGHSKFAYVLIQSLRQIDQDTFTAGDLFQRFIQPWVSGTSNQVPQYSVIQNSGHAYGDFVFTRLQGDGSIPSPIGNVLTPAADIERIPRESTNPEAEAVSATLRRYEQAYGSMDINHLKAVWPSLSRAQVDKLKAGFTRAQAVQVQLQNCGPATTTNDTAQVQCVQAMTYTFAGQQQQPETHAVTVSLKKGVDGGWVVEDVRAR